ncbi:hypothetical protein BVI2075_180002 [Burkholderia vietnamiensis]|nr:hypothetical protein BVI2075_180002 [Burkholderia vietnamiensis]
MGRPSRFSIRGGHVERRRSCEPLRRDRRRRPPALKGAPAGAEYALRRAERFAPRFPPAASPHRRRSRTQPPARISRRTPLPVFS